MGSRTGIAWTDCTWNPVRGCSRVSEGCRNCYAEGIAARFSDVGRPFHGFANIGARKGEHRWTGRVELVPEKLEDPLHWRKPRRVFVNSMSDLFHEKLSARDIAAVFGVMAACPHLTFQVLTKRPERMREWFAAAPWGGVAPGGPADECVISAGVRMGRDEFRVPVVPWPLPNVWVGASVEDQATADARIPVLLDSPAALRFVSYEPALEAIDIRRWLAGSMDPALPRAQILAQLGRPGIAWAIVGGESGPKARPFDVGWARSVVEQCRRAGVPCFVKQLGARPIPLTPMRLPSFNAFSGRRHRGWIEDGPHAISDPAGADPSEWPEDLRVREFPEVVRG